MMLYEDNSSPTKIYLELKASPEGGVTLFGHDIGKAPKECFGHDDYEYAVTIPADGLQDLVVSLLSEKYARDAMAVSRLREYCQNREIPCCFWSYP